MTRPKARGDNLPSSTINDSIPMECPLAAVPDVEVRRSVVVVEHCDHDPEEPGDLWHPLALSVALGILAAPERGVTCDLELPGKARDLWQCRSL
jgi:hypothetical protein